MFLLAGHETTAGALNWALRLLARHPTEAPATSKTTLLCHVYVASLVLVKVGPRWVWDAAANYSNFPGPQNRSKQRRHVFVGHYKSFFLLTVGLLQRTKELYFAALNGYVSLLNHSCLN